MTRFDSELGAYLPSDLDLEDHKEPPCWPVRAFLLFAVLGLVVRPVLHLMGVW